MAEDLNHYTFTGRLVGSMEVQHTQNGWAIGNFCVAVNRSQKDKEGNWNEVASFFDCVMYGKSVDNLDLYLYKGRQVAIQGHAQQDRWEKNGQKYSRVRFVVEKLKLYGGVKDQEQKGNKNTSPSQVAVDEPAAEFYQDEYTGLDENGIPF